MALRFPLLPAILFLPACVLPLKAVALALPDAAGSKVAANARADTALPADWNADGTVDLVVINRQSEDFPLGAVHLLPGGGDGAFANPRRLLGDVSNFGPETGLQADFNQDGLPDLLADNTVVNNEGVLVFLNAAEAPGSLELAASLPFGFGQVAADFNQDGYPDLAFLTSAVDVEQEVLSGTVEVYLNLGMDGGDWLGFSAPQSFDGTFDPGPADARAGADLAAGDIDGDGDLDLASDTLALFNDGSGTFSALLLAAPLGEDPLLLAPLEPGGPDMLVQGRLEGEETLGARPAALDIFRWSVDTRAWESAGVYELGSLSAFDIQPQSAEVTGDTLSDVILAAGSHLLLLAQEAPLSFVTRVLRDESDDPAPIAYTGRPQVADLDADGVPDLVTPQAGTQIQPYAVVDVQQLAWQPIEIRAWVFLDRDRNGRFPFPDPFGSSEPDSGVQGVALDLTRLGDAEPVLSASSGPNDLNGDEQLDPRLEVGTARMLLEGVQRGAYRLAAAVASPALAPSDPSPGDPALWYHEFSVLPGDSIDLLFGMRQAQINAGADLGDLPESGTTFQSLVDAGPVHFQPALGPGDALFLGAGVDYDDPEADNLENNARFDDTQGVDDEDGVLFRDSFIGGAPTRLVLLNDGRPGFGNVFIDLDRSGRFENDEWLVRNVELAGDGHTEVAITPTPELGVSAGSWLRNLHLRARVSPVPLRSETEAVIDGEVEDYLLPGLDFGDAPDTNGAYPTFALSGGANHALLEPLRLGDAVDADEDGAPTSAADGDRAPGGTEENGVTFLSSLRAGATADLQVRFSGSGFLQGFMDFNRDGDWGDPGEQVLLDHALDGEGPRSLRVNVPAGADSGLSYARFRFSSMTGLGAGGPAPDGEVEDYRIQLLDTRDAPLIELLDGGESLEGGWRYLPWFGYYLPFPSGWFYHFLLGPVWPAGAGDRGLFFYVPGVGWLYTNAQSYPYFYAYGLESRVFFLRQDALPDRWFYVFDGDAPGWRNLPLE